MSRIFTRWIIAALMVGRLCVFAQSDRPQSKSGGDQPVTSISQLDYVLQPNDLIRVVVFQEPDLEREVRLSADSKITLPFLLAVDLKGKTIAQAQAAIRDLYNQGYLVNPQISITVLEYSKELVNVLGQVNNAGPVNIPPDQPLNLLDAIARAGGFTRLADRKHVRLTRMGEEHRTVTTTINVDDIIQSTNSDQQLLQKGDVIYVPERIL